MHAEGGSGNSGENGDKPTEIPSECAVKVFKTTIQEFKNRNKYIQDDYRYFMLRQIMLSLFKPLHVELAISFLHLTA